MSALRSFRPGNTLKSVYVPDCEYADTAPINPLNLSEVNEHGLPIIYITSGKDLS